MMRSSIVPVVDDSLHERARPHHFTIGISQEKALKKSRAELDARKVFEAISLYNRFRSPEATTELLNFKKDKIIVQFKGPFCITCGFYDCLEDFIFELKQLVDVSISIKAVEEKAFQTFIVRYLVV